MSFTPLTLGIQKILSTRFISTAKSHSSMLRRRHKAVIIGLLMLAAVSLMIPYDTSSVPYDKSRSTFNQSYAILSENSPQTYIEKNGNESKLILAYTSLYGYPLDIRTYGRTEKEMIRTMDPLSECEYKCEWSMNRSDFERSDAVLFHMYNNEDTKDFVLQELPKRHLSNQKWVLMIREPPAFFYPDQLKLLNGLFNLSMTYQSDSDVVIPYGKYWRLSSADAKRVSKKMDYLAFKDKMIAWLVSNCVTSSRREDYVRELQQHIDIDIYGDCGQASESKNYKREGFRELLGEKYLFYVAFENADCDEYITEKLWTSLSAGMIPIVRGRRSQYQKFAPPNSFIHVDDFPSTKHLADHIRAVSSNLTMLQSYHKWRRKYGSVYRLFTSNRDWVCDLCEKVHTTPQQTLNVYEHFSEDTRCLTYDKGKRNRTGESVEDITRLRYF
ncbi:4-galactosyl-N-acetylglucosaminide 3-alpha-L-fucosyltransferase FUT6-like [Watersipora subatra]|uniref:4-galactosyl-N-acetylglucosaminide 3-alpha-L-fucosyltransferase FUT6-like n=1 Tax=Watersipora subatra TaxID=2589382 RepID=UPI00355B174E